LESQKAEALAELWSAQAARLAGITAARDSSRQAVGIWNQEQAAATVAAVDRYGGGLGWFTVACLVLLLISVVLHEVYQKGAEIEEKAQPGQYAFAPGLWSEAVAAIGERGQYLARRRLTAFADATPPPPLPAQLKPLYDFSGITLPAAQVASEAEEGQIIRLPVANVAQGGAGSSPEAAQAAQAAAVALELLQTAQEMASASPEAAQALTLKADQVLTMYLGPEASPEAVDALRKSCLEHLRGEGPNPFAHLHRRPIGYQFTAVPTVATPLPSGPPGKNIAPSNAARTTTPSATGAPPLIRITTAGSNQPPPVRTGAPWWLFFTYQKTVMKKVYEWPRSLRQFMPEAQQMAVREILQETEDLTGYAQQVLTPLQHQVEAIPEMRATEEIPLNEKTLQAHFFMGRSDWYIVEWDRAENLAFGYTILNGDDQNAEWGYIPIGELVRAAAMQLDFFWEPVRFKNLDR